MEAQITKNINRDKAKKIALHVIYIKEKETYNYLFTFFTYTSAQQFLKELEQTANVIDYSFNAVF